MLQAALIDVGITVPHRVVFRCSVDIREIESSESGPVEDGHVRIVWEQPVDVIGERICDGMRSGAGELFYQPTVLIACLKHVRWAGSAARVKVKSYSHLFRPRMLIHKSFRSEQAVLFSVREEKNHIVFEWRTRFECS